MTAWIFRSLAEDGHFECFDTAAGALRWSLDLSATPDGTSVVAGDVDGNGQEAFLVGLSDGRLVCIAEEGTEGSTLWQLQFAAAVANPVIADVDGDDVAQIVISTADGYVRILRD